MIKKDHKRFGWNPIVKKNYPYCKKRFADKCKEGNGKFVPTDQGDCPLYKSICLHCLRHMAKQGYKFRWKKKEVINS